MVDRYGKTVGFLSTAVKSKNRLGQSIVIEDSEMQAAVAALREHLRMNCPTCGDNRNVAGLTVKCRDWHEICNQCLAPYDQPKNAGCRRRKHPKVSSEAAAAFGGSAARQEEK